jgi:uncharacterized membrane protein YbhN (UPF0104 family)
VDRQPQLRFRNKAALALVAILGLIYVGRHYFGEISRISEARLAGIVAIAFIHLFSLWIQGLTLKLGLAPFGNTITNRQGLALSVMGSYANLLVPRSGIATTATYLKRNCQTKLIDYSSVVLYNAALFVLCSSLVGSLLVTGTWATQGIQTEWWLILSLVGLVAVSWLAVFSKWRPPFGYRGIGSQTLAKFCHAALQLVDSGNVWTLAGLNFALTLLRAGRLYVAFWALSIEVNPLGVLLASALGDLVFIFAVTPAAIGFREAAITFAAGAMSTTAALALSAALFDRLVFSGTVIVLAQIIISLSLGSTTSKTSALRDSLTGTGAEG